MTGSLLTRSTSPAAAARACREMARRARAPISASRSAGFPNLFTITGPGSPSVLANMIQAIEQHVDWIADCIGHMRDVGARDASSRAARHEDAWVAHVNEVPTLAALDLQLLVCRRQHPRQAARLHALYRRLPGLCAEVQRGRGQGLRWLPPELAFTSRSRCAATGAVAALRVYLPRLIANGRAVMLIAALAGTLTHLLSGRRL